MGHDRRISGVTELFLLIIDHSAIFGEKKVREQFPFQFNRYIAVCAERMRRTNGTVEG